MEVFTTAFTEEQLISGDTLCKTGMFNKIGEYKVEAGETITIGQGSGGYDSAIGRIFADLRDNSAAPGAKMTGKIRLSVWSPQDRPLWIMKEFHTSKLDTSATDVTKQTPLNEGDDVLTEDKKLVIEFRPDVEGTISKSQSTFVMDITQGVV
jgi:hypothetical protein